jgi:hypothetical protein
VGVHTGPVYCFWDWGRGGKETPPTAVSEEDQHKRWEIGDWNYIGDGINGGQRVLAAAGKDSDDVVFLSGQVKRKLTAYPGELAECRLILDNLNNRGRKEDKHKNFWRIYEVNYGAVCGGRLSPDALR